MSLAEKLSLQRAEQAACAKFAKHLAHCEYCMSRWHKEGLQGLCAAGQQVRNSHIKAARQYAKLDAEFAARYASLIS